MDNIYLHSGKSVKKMSLVYFICCLPLIIFGFYKNGIIPYMKGYNDIFTLLNPLIVPFICYYINLLVMNIITKKLSKHLVEHDLFALYGLLIGMCLPPQMSFIILLIFPFVSAIYLLICQKIKINYLALMLLILLLINFLLIGGDFNQMFMNTYEKNSLSYSLWAQFFGYNYSGFSSGNIILIIIMALVINYFANFKVSICLYGLGSYFLFGLLLAPFTKNYSLIIDNVFNYSFIFIMFIIASENISSAYTKSGMATYGILIGIVFWLLSFLPPIMALLLSIILLSLLSPILNIMYRRVRK